MSKLIRRYVHRILFKSERRAVVHKSYVRHLSVDPAPKSENNILKSLYGEIKHEEITVDQHAFEDAALWAEKPAISCATSGRSYTYGTFMMLIERCAKALITQLRLAPGDCIGFILPNMPEFALVFYGACKAGLISSPTNPLYTTGEIRRQFTDCNVKAIVTMEMLMPVAMEVSKHLQDYKGTISVGGNDDKVQGIYSLQSLLMCDEATDLPKVDPNDVCVIPYSSGTTGLPKGVMLTHKNIVSNNKQFCNPAFMKDNGLRGKGTVSLAIPPLFHIYGIINTLNSLYVGNHLVFIPKFTPEDYIQALIKYKPGVLNVVPAIVQFLAVHPDVKKEHLETVEFLGVGSAPITRTLLEKFLLKAGKSEKDVAVVQGYGLTETSPLLLMTPANYPKEKIGTTGQIVASTQMKIVSTTNGEALGPNQPGEIFVKGPQVMKGYINNEAATREIIDNEGWLHTGDVAYYDEDQFFYIVDRTKELIKVKGFQVSPTEIENLIMTQPEVADVAVVGIPHEEAGEVPKAYVVLKPNQKVTEQQICDLVAKNLVKYKHLAGGVQFIDSIPRNAGGKIIRSEMKALARQR